MNFLRMCSMALVVTAMVGCSKPAPKSPIADTVKAFENDRKVGLQEYGAKSVASSRQNISSTDCMVFEEAAKKPLPTTLGGLSAYTESMRVRVFAGCVKPEVGLTDYETARRALLNSWTQTRQNLPSTTDILLTSSNMGKLIEDITQEVVTEEMACQAQLGENKRDRESGASVNSVSKRCSRDSAASKPKKQCLNAWINSYAHQAARGPRDDLSTLSELVSRYHMVYLACSPAAAQEYVQFHSTVPPHLFQQQAYRLSIPIDPILQCQIQEIRNKMSRKAPYRAEREWVECAKRYQLNSMYTADQMPHLITEEMITGKDTSWLFDPSKAQENPKLWDFNECEKQTISLMRSYGLNLTSPQALKRYCVDQSRKQKRNQ